MELYAEQNGDRCKLDATPKNHKEAAEIAAKTAVKLFTLGGGAVRVQVFDNDRLICEVNAK